MGLKSIGVCNIFVLVIGLTLFNVFNPGSDVSARTDGIEGRSKRQATNSIDVETVIVLDAHYVANMRAIGHTTNQSLVDLMQLKWSGVQAEWGREDVLGYDVKISIKEVAVWETNPSWYFASTVLSNTLYTFCQGTKKNGLWKNYDYIHLITGRSDTDVAGVSYTGDVCLAGRKCSVTTDTGITEYVIAAHEMGHSLGMGHDGDVGCTSSSDAGIMGSKTSGWSSCSVAALDYMIKNEPSVSCLTTTNVGNDEVVALTDKWPGMLVTDDDICSLKYGQYFRMKSSRTSCSGYTCTNLAEESELYGVSFSSPKPTDGSYCGEQMVCSTQFTGGSYPCISWTETGLDLTMSDVVIGGWSAWQPMTSCSRTCGAGVQYRQRLCNNPKPLNSPWCPGEEFDAQVCNTQPCDDDSEVESDLINQRAGEVCSHWKAKSLFEVIGKNSENYLTTGSKYSKTGDGQCEVKCNTVQGYSSGSEKHGLMPDGTPCNHESLSSFVESNSLPRTSGMYGRCVNGFCHLFGCDGKSGITSRDGCGVCGGDGSTCQVVEGVYTKILASKERATIAVLPASARRIQFYFPYTSMPMHFLEVRTKEDVAVVKYTDLDTMTNPVTFAGTHWYLKATKQFLYAEGPVDQAVYIKLFNYGTNSNVGVSYAYTLPTKEKLASCTGYCANGGTWNASTCSCDCASGFYGLNCTGTCSKFCKNSQTTDASCKCDCRGNTYGNRCDCRYPFTGIDCKDCKITSCQNGGTFNATACRCSCPQGFGDLDCSSPCKDANGDTALCLTNAAAGQCDSKNEVMEQDCYLSCGLCTPACSDKCPSSTSTTPTTSTTTLTTTTTSTTPTTTTTTELTTPTTTQKGKGKGGSGNGKGGGGGGGKGKKKP